MVRKTLFICLLTLFTFQIFAQNVAVVNGMAISSKEFMWLYKKNHAGVSHPKFQDLLFYLELYINFKLKVADARAMKLDADTSYKAEIESYETALKNQKKISPKSVEYNYILNEYREGVLMFNISEQKIWSKVRNNEFELIDYFEKNRAKYEHKPYEEVKGQVISDYQQILENDWINDLKKKYAVKVNQDELKKLTKF